MRKSDFILPPEKIYLCGHSLGPMTHRARLRVHETLQQWEEFAVSGWSQASWIDLPKTIGAKIATLINATPHEVIVNDSTTVNLFKVLCAAAKLNPSRHVILTDHDNFPTDLYVAQGFAELFADIVIKKINADQLIASLDQSVSVLLLTQVNYKTGAIYDMAAITELAHQRGIIVAWDLSHSIGAIEIDVTQCNVDFAVGCTYKYLNGGPGAPSFIYANQNHHSHMQSPICGWLAHRAPFAFEPTFSPQEDAGKFLTGSPNVLSLAALDGALDIWQNVDFKQYRQQSLALAKFLQAKMNQEIPDLVCISPNLAGGHVAFVHPEALAIGQALMEAGVMIDVREPNVIRCCVNALYINQTDLEVFVHTLKRIVQSKHYQQPLFAIKQRIT